MANIRPTLYAYFHSLARSFQLLLGILLNYTACRCIFRTRQLTWPVFANLFIPVSNRATWRQRLQTLHNGHLPQKKGAAGLNLAAPQRF